MRKAQVTATISQDAFQRANQVRKTGGIVTAVLVFAMVSALSGISLSPSALQFKAMKVGSGSGFQRVKLTNRGTTDFHAEQVKVLGPAAGDFHVNPAPCSVVPSGQSCFLEVEYRPQQPGSRQAQLVVASADGKELQATLTGTATSSTVKLTPRFLNFGSIPSGGSSAPGQVSLASDDGFRIHDVSLKGDVEQFAVESNSCSNNSGELKNCMMSVRFSPRSEGIWSAQLMLSDDATGSPHIVTLNGVSPAVTPGVDSRPPVHAVPTTSAATPAVSPIRIPTETVPVPGPAQPPIRPNTGDTQSPTRPPELPPHAENQPLTPYVPPYPQPQPPAAPPHSAPTYPMIRVSPSALDLSTNGQQQVTVSNTGNAPLQIRISLAGQNPDRFSANAGACHVIAAAHSCNIPVIYTSTQQVQETTYSNAQLQIAPNATNLATQYVALRWQKVVAAPPPHLTTKPFTLDFSSFYRAVEMRMAQPSAPQLTLTMVNDGQVDLRQLNLRVGASDAGPFGHSRNCTQLSRGQACTETVSFSPKSRGNYSDSLYVFEGTRQLATVSLLATMPAPPPSPPSNGNSSGNKGTVFEKPASGSKLATVPKSPEGPNPGTAPQGTRKPPSLGGVGTLKSGNDYVALQPSGPQKSALPTSTLPKNAGLVNRTIPKPVIQQPAPTLGVQATRKKATPPPPQLH